MKTLLNLSAILFCAMLVSCNHKQEARQDESSPDEPSKIVNADNTGTDVDPANRNGKSPIEPNVSPAEATVHVVIPREYFAEYERDKVAFTDKYKDGAIEMTGEAIMVGNAFDAPFIKLDVGRDYLTGVHCFTKDKQPWAIVVPGQQVTLRGKLPSRLFGAQVQDCEILKTGPSPAIKIDAAALASEYAADRKACTEKYKDKYLYVDGKVEAIDTKAGIVHLAGNDGVRIRCKFDTYGEKEQIPSLKPGDQVHVIGHYIGSGGGANEVLLTLCLLYDPSQIKPVPALKADPKRTADTTTVLAKYPDDFRPNASGHPDSSGHGKWFYQSSETQNPSSPEANLRQLNWDEGRKRYESPLRGKNNTFPSIDERMHPSPDPPHFAVLRWQSRDSASIRVRGNFSKLADAKESNGVRALVFVDGEQVFDQEVGPRDAKGVDFDFAALVKPDSVVDFVVDPKQDAYWDSTKLIVTIEQSVGKVNSGAGTGKTVPQVPADQARATEITNSIGMKLMLIPAGQFTMGSPDSDKSAEADEKPQHRVRITKPFYIGVYEVTQGEYQRVMGENPSFFSANGGGKEDVAGKDTTRYPVEKVSWEDAVAFCRKLSAKEGQGYRLPTEAEWEYACRAGSKAAYHFGDEDANLGDYAWYDKNAGPTTHPVGEKKANAWGLYDMHGNVWEWCQDWYDESYYATSPTDDPTGPRGGSNRVTRGGGWSYDRCNCRATDRFPGDPSDRDIDLGFRLVREVSAP